MLAGQNHFALLPDVFVRRLRLRGVGVFTALVLSSIFVSAQVVSPLLGSSVTNTALTVNTLRTSSPITTVANGVGVTLRAVVTNASAAPIYPGTVNIIDLSLPADAQTIGSAQLLPNGTAALSVQPALGAHTYRAVYQGTIVNASSISPTETLSVTGLFSSSTTLAAVGTPTDYTLTAAVSGYGYTAVPTGTVNFIDTSAGNAVIASANLSSATFTTTQVAQPTLTTGSVPTSIATGDFNGDGKPDAVIVNSGDGTMTVELGNGDGTFTAGATIITGDTPTSAIAADLNNDGKLDLAVVLRHSSAVHIYIGNGDGTFTSGASIVAGLSPFALAVGDLNLDGNLDLVASMDGTNTDAILLGAGDGTFTLGTPIPVGLDPRHLVIADFNNDGNPDIATANFSNNTVSVALGAGNGTFTQATGSPIAVGSTPIGLAAADLNADGNIDLAVLNQGSNNVYALRGNGTGAFTLISAPITVGTTPVDIIATDFNSDGSIDLIAVNGDGSVSVLSNNGNAVFIVSSPIAASTGSFTLAAPDLNGDGRPDLIVAHSGSASAAVYLSGQIATLSKTNITFPTTGSHVVVATYLGDTNFATSTSGPISLQSNTSSTTTALAATPAASAAYGQTVMLTAAISPVTNFGQTAGGTVTFYDQGGVQISAPIAINSSGVASVALPLQAMGGHVYTAIYSGSPAFLTSTSAPLSYTVTQATATVTIPSYTGLYSVSGSRIATVAPQFVVTGQATPTGTLTYQFPGFTTQTVTLGSGQATITIPAGLSIGAATLTINYSGDGNYAASAGSLSYTITAYPLTVTVNSATRVYGAANPTFTGTIAGAQGTDTFTATYSTTATTASPVGTDPITATVQGANIGNYAVTVVPGTLTVTRAPINISANSTSRVFAAANPTFTGNISGALNGDLLTLTFTTTATQTSDVGTYPIVPVLSGTAASNYTPTALNGTLTITPLGITIRANNATKTFGTVNPAFTGTITGAPANSGLTVTCTTAATQFSAAGSYAIVPALSGTSASDYTATVIDGTLTITQSPTTTLLQSSASSSSYGSSVTFTATVTPTTGGGTPTGSISFYDGAILLGTINMTTGTVSLPTIGLSVGTHTITAVYGGDTSFTGSSSNSIAQIVQQATLHVTANSATRVYGAVDPTFTSTITGAIPGDTFTVTYATNATATSGIGVYQITPTATGPTLVNYNVVYTAGAYTITPAPLTITASNATRMFDTANPTFTGTVSGAKNGDTFTLSFSTVAVPMSDVGMYPIVPSVTGTALVNYTVTPVNGTLTITPATGLVVTAGNATRAYGTANPTFTGTISGSFANLGLTVTGATAATITSDAGNYSIVPSLSGVNPANYTATLINGILTISPAGTSITLASNSSSALAGTNVVLTATVASATTGVPSGQVFFYSGTTFLGASPLAGGAAALTTNAIPQGTSVLTAHYNGNFDFTASVSNSVVQAIVSNLPVLTVTANSFTRVAGAANPTFTGTVTGAVNGDSFTETFVTTATTSSPVGTYAIIPSVTGTNIANYQVSIVPGVLTITQTGAVVVLQSSSTTAAAGAPVVLTAVLTGSSGVTPTGNVLFYDGAILLGTVLSQNGVASLTVTTLTSGTHTLSARTAGDNNYAAATSNSITQTITGTSGGGTGADYSISASPTSLTIKQGNTGTTTLTFTPINGYTGQITLSCATVPQYASCFFNPATITLNGTTAVTTVLTVNTKTTTASVREPALPGQTRSLTSLAGFTLLPAMLLAGLFGLRRSGVAGMRLLALLLAVGTMLSLSGCVKVNVAGSGSTGITPTGTSTLTITASPVNVTTGVYHTLPVVITITP